MSTPPDTHDSLLRRALVAGAFVAVPAAAMAQVLYDDVIRPWRLAKLAAADSS
jgi:hypothetical protein